MRIFLLGATGGTGLALTSQALERGHDVTVFVRSPDRVKERHERLKVVTGDPSQVEHLAQALVGQEAVLSALGTATREPTTVRGDAARSTIEAMQRSGLRRLLAVSSALLFADIGMLGGFVGYFFRNALRDSLAMEQLIEANDLDWTIVRPPRLTYSKPTEHYRVSDHAPPAGSISRADLARFMLDAVEQRAHVKKVVGVSR